MDLLGLLKEEIPLDFKKEINLFLDAVFADDGTSMWDEFTKKMKHSRDEAKQFFDELLSDDCEYDEDEDDWGGDSDVPVIVEKGLNVNFKKLHEDAVLPKYAKYGDAGMDCYAVDDGKITDMYISFNLGFSVEIPYGYVGLLFPRSSVSKKDLILANSVGVIDSGYRGEVQARFKQTVPKLNRDRYDIQGYKKGDAVCQLMILPYPKIHPVWADELSETDRGDGGFGHTDK